MLKIKLRLNGEIKTYSQDFISGYMFRRALDLDDMRNKYLKKIMDQEGQPVPMEEQENLLDELYHFISEVFEKQFTAEEYENGTDARAIVDQSWAIVHGIISQVLNPLTDLDDAEGNHAQKKRKSKPSRRYS